MMKIIAHISDALLNIYSALPLDNTLSSDYIICRLHRDVNFNMKEDSVTLLGNLDRQTHYSY